jgi:V8-like Glu-specific endopeptidase
MSILHFTMPVVFAVTLIAPLSAQASQHCLRTINQRQSHQQNRIFNGVKNDQLSRNEYNSLERRSLSIQRQERRDRLDDGAFTPLERYQLNQRLDNVSTSIYRDRHD